MPKVTFVNEHRVVSVVAGRTVGEVARDAGIVLGGQCFLDPSAPNAVTPRSWIETLRGARGTRRLPDRVRVLGDVKVYSMPAASNRVRVARPIDDAPKPTVQPEAKRKPDDAASTALHVYGHPDAVGRGVAEIPNVPHPPSSHPNAARPQSMYPVEPTERDDEDTAL